MNKNTFGRVTKRSLLFIAAAVWTFAGNMLIFRGLISINRIRYINWLDIFFCLLGGIFFYFILFSKISDKHIHRILNLENEHPHSFSFFNARSYLMMGIMILMGISIRLLNIIPIYYLSLFYVFMGTPLLISSFRFYSAGFGYKYANIKTTNKE